MPASRAVHRVLVPVGGGDVSDAGFDRARARLVTTGVRLVPLQLAGAPAV